MMAFGDSQAKRRMADTKESAKVSCVYVRAYGAVRFMHAPNDQVSHVKMYSVHHWMDIGCSFESDYLPIKIKLMRANARSHLFNKFKFFIEPITILASFHIILFIPLTLFFFSSFRFFCFRFKHHTNISRIFICVWFSIARTKSPILKSLILKRY